MTGLETFDTPLPGRRLERRRQRPGLPALVSRELYGFVPAACLPASFADTGPLRRFRCISGGQVAALAGPLSLHLPVRNPVRKALSRLRTYQRALEEVMRHTPVLPARIGMRVPERHVLMRLLRRNEDRLLDAIEAYGHLRQVEIQVTGAASGCRALAAREHIRLELKGLSLATREDTPSPARTLLSQTLLIRPFDEARLDATLARLDGEFGGWLNFRCIGPLPPCRFVRVAVRRTGHARDHWRLSLNSVLPGRAWPAATFNPVPSRGAA